MNFFSSLHPFVLLFYFISVVAITMFTMHPILLCLAFLGAICYGFLLEHPLAVLKSLGFYALLFLLIALTNPLFSHNGVTPLFFLNGNPVTLEAIFYGAAIAGMLVSVFYWCRCYQHVMTSDKFLYLFGKIIPKLSLILSMSLRFVPLFLQQVKKISMVQKTMGLYATKSVTERLKGAFGVFGAIVTWSLENAVDTAASMRARGYGLKGRTSFHLFRFYRKDAIILGLMLVLLVSIICLMAQGALDYTFYPRMTGILFTGQAIACYLLLFLFYLLPLFVELKERLLWNYYVSKI